ncbi:MAG: hydroxyacid dehydrogenase [Chloroflexota bacterium]|nr:MAG: hydroxyacid dehydrogenase [Chloroflexota bacterium]
MKSDSPGEAAAIPTDQARNRPGASARPRIVLLVPPTRVPLMFTPDALDALARLGQVVRADGTTDEIAADLPELLEGADVAITGWGAPPIPAELFGYRLRFVAHAAGSVKRLVPPEVVERGVVVCHAATIIADAVCEYTIALILMGLRRPHEMAAAMAAGADWRSAGYTEPRTLAGRVVGVIGAGYVGRKVINLLRAFEAQVILVDPFAGDDIGVPRLSLEEAFRQAEILTVHAPVTPATERMIRAEHLALLRDGALFINVARSRLVDSDALLAELRQGRLWAALDVFDEEPLSVSDPLRSLPNVLVTPHAAGFTRDTYARQGMTMVEEIGRHLRGEPLRYRVAPDRYTLMA